MNWSAMKTSQIRDFRRSLRRFERVMQAQLKNCCAQITLPQCLILLEVDEEQRLTVGQLATRLRLDNSTLSRTIDGLVLKRLLERARDEQDRRVVWIRLTAKGSAVCAAVHKQNDAVYRGIFAKIPASRRESVIRSFEVLVQAFLDQERESDVACCAPSGGKSTSRASRGA
jgi:DNA-binding MarR family transcriptional regulator